MSVKSQIDRLNAVKTRVRTNLAAQGITVPADTTLDEMATLILSVAGYTPEKGVDYWTEADQESIVQQVITALGTPVFGRVDDNNNIILTGELADGTYTIKYEDKDGKLVEIGTVDIGGPTVFDVPITWFIGTKLSKTTGAVESTTATDYNASDFISLIDGASYVVSTTNDIYNSMSVVYYNDNNAFVGYQAALWSAAEGAISAGKPQSGALVIPAGATKIRLRHYENAANHGWSSELVTLTGTLEHTSEPLPSYTNLAKPDDSNWIDGKRYNSSKNLVDWVDSTTGRKGAITNYIDVSSCKEYIHVKGLDMTKGESRYYKYNTVGGELAEATNAGSSGYVETASYDSSVQLIPAHRIQSATIWRLGGLMTGTKYDVIITIDEEIR